RVLFRSLPPILRPRWSSASSKELRMSLPITAVGPLKVETKPILMVSPADAGCASARMAAPASQNAFFIITPSSIIAPEPGDRAVPRASLSGEVFCARNRRSAASMNRLSGFGPSAHTPIGLHHNSLGSGTARTIVPVARATIVAVEVGLGPLRHCEQSEAIQRPQARKNRIAS